MEITFGDKKLKKFINDKSKLYKQYGKKHADKILLRIAQLSAAQSLEDVRYLPGNYHELKADRKGQWACNLDRNNRLIFIPLENPIPTNEDGIYIWFEIKGIEVTEIVDYH